MNMPITGTFTASDQQYQYELEWGPIPLAGKSQRHLTVKIRRLSDDHRWTGATDSSDMQIAESKMSEWLKWTFEGFPDPNQFPDNFEIYRGVPITEATVPAIHQCQC